MDIIKNSNTFNPRRERVSHGMSALSDTIGKRQDLMKFLLENLSYESNVWARDMIGRMNKLFSSNNSDGFIKVKYFYDNALIFFTEYIEDITASEILCTIYICALQVGVVDFGDSVESNSEFLECIDIDDWKFVNIDTLKDFDIRTAMLIVSSLYTHEPQEIRCGGIFTMQLIDYLHTM